MKLVKNGSDLVIPDNGEIVLELTVSRLGVKLKSPLPPNEVCKLLNNISTDIMFNSFQMKEVPRIETPV